MISSEPTASRLARTYLTNIEDAEKARATTSSDPSSTEERLAAIYSITRGLDIEEPDVLHEECEDTTTEEIPYIHQFVPDFSIGKHLKDVQQTIDSDVTLKGLLEIQASVSSSFLAPEFSPRSETVPPQNTSSCFGSSTFLTLYSEHETRMERLSEYMLPVPWIDPATTVSISVDSLEAFPSIQNVSVAFQLNFWQHVTFENYARHVLYAFAQDIAMAANFEVPSSPNIRNQLIGLVGGEAGTGKSTMIHALIKFAELWQRPESIETLAFTGVAANNIKGRTIHSGRNLLINSSDARQPSSEMKQKFDKVVLTIVDEISMTDQRLVGRADAVSRSMVPLYLQTHPWGGKHVIVTGDWLQLPPVQGIPCFVRPHTGSNCYNHQGFDLYNSINFVVFLVENMRSRLDSTYTAMLSWMRRGAMTDDDINLLNTRVNAFHFERQSPYFYKPVIVATNKLRCAINLQQTLHEGAARTSTVYVCLAKPSSRSRDAFKRVKNLDDSWTERIPFKLLYFIGMPVMISYNDPSNPDVASNGTVGFIVGHSMDNPHTESMEIGEAIVHRLLDQPTALYIKIADSDSDYNQGLPPGIIRLLPIKKRVSVTISASHHNLGPKRLRSEQLSMTVTQFPVIAAYACTAEKLQGKTCSDGVTITHLQRGKNSIPPQALYVTFSRATSLVGLTLTTELTLRTFSKHT